MGKGLIKMKGRVTNESSTQWNWVVSGSRL